MCVWCGESGMREAEVDLVDRPAQSLVGRVWEGTFAEAAAGGVRRTLEDIQARLAALPGLFKGPLVGLSWNERADGFRYFVGYEPDGAEEGFSTELVRDAVSRLAVTAGTSPTPAGDAASSSGDADTTSATAANAAEEPADGSLARSGAGADLERLDLPAMRYAAAWHAEGDGAVVEHYRGMLHWMQMEGLSRDVTRMHHREEYPIDADFAGPPVMRLMLPLTPGSAPAPGGRFSAD